MTPAEAKELLTDLDEVAPYIAQVDAVGVGFELEPSGLVLSAWYDATPGSAEQAKALTGPKLDLDWVRVRRSTCPTRRREQAHLVEGHGSQERADQASQQALEKLDRIRAEALKSRGLVLQRQRDDDAAGPSRAATLVRDDPDGDADRPTARRRCARQSLGEEDEMV